MKGTKRKYRVRELYEGHWVVEYLNKTINKWRETRNEKVVSKIKEVIANDPEKIHEDIFLARCF
jgi:hypothetical protein